MPILALEKLLGRLSAASFAIWPTRVRMAGLLTLHRTEPVRTTTGSWLHACRTAKYGDDSLVPDAMADYIFGSDSDKVIWDIPLRREPQALAVSRGLLPGAEPVLLEH